MRCFRFKFIKFKTLNYNKYIGDCNYYSLKIADLKNLIKLNSESTDKIIFIENKPIKNKVYEEKNKENSKDYYIDGIKELK